jgi:hypothetical protein
MINQYEIVLKRRDELRMMLERENEKLTQYQDGLSNDMASNSELLYFKQMTTKTKYNIMQIEGVLGINEKVLSVSRSFLH